MRFSRQKYLSGLPFPSPGALPDPGIEARSPVLQADALPTEPPGEPRLGGQIKSQARAAALPLLPGQVGSSEIGPRPLQRILVGSSQAHFVWFSLFLFPFPNPTEHTRADTHPSLLPSGIASHQSS